MKFSTNVAGIAIAMAVLAGCAPEVKEDPAVNAMRAAAESEAQMVAAMGTLIDAWNTGNTDTLDAIAVADYQRRAPDQNADNLDELKAFIAEIHTVYPDFRITNDGSAAGPDGGFVQWTVTGTDTGSQDATGKALKATGISRYQFVDGKITSELVVFDTGSVMTQLETDTLPRVEE